MHGLAGAVPQPDRDEVLGYVSLLWSPVAFAVPWVAHDQVGVFIRRNRKYYFYLGVLGFFRQPSRHLRAVAKYGYSMPGENRPERGDHRIEWSQFLFSARAY